MNNLIKLRLLQDIITVITITSYPLLIKTANGTVMYYGYNHYCESIFYMFFKTFLKVFLML